MVLDVRAQIICNLGPVISGSVKDDHVQGQGLVMTTGELLIAGLITPAHGDVVKLGYITPDGGRAARFPRGPFYVTKAFADPLANQTQVSIADKLAFEKGKGGGIINTQLVAALKGELTIQAEVVDLFDVLSIAASRLGVPIGVLASFNINKQVVSIKSEDYVETISEILASAGTFGYVNRSGNLVSESYRLIPTKGPVVRFRDLVDLNGNQGGLDYTETPTASGAAQIANPVSTEEEIQDAERDVFFIPGGYGRFRSSFDSNETETITSMKINLKDGTTLTFPVVEKTSASEVTAEPDNRVTARFLTVFTSLVKANSQVIQDYINAGLPSPDPLAVVPSLREEYLEYEEIPPDPLTAEEKKSLEAEIRSAKEQLINNGKSEEDATAATVVMLPKLPTYRIKRETISEIMSTIETLGRIGIRDYSKLTRPLPLSPFSDYKQVTKINYLYGEGKVKKVEQVFVAYGLTQMGQQAIAAAVAKAPIDLDFWPIVEQFHTLVLEDEKVTITEIDKPKGRDPVPGYLAHLVNADVVIQGASRMQIGADDPTRTNTATQFEVPFLPDDVVNDDGSITLGNAITAAEQFGEDQNRLLLGHRLGLQVTTALGVLPTKPLRAFHLRKGGITATYRTNGTVWTFDAGSCLVSTDALYWGLAGGDVSGPRWTPVARGTSALPIPPADVDNGPQAPANSVDEITTEEGTVSISSITSTLSGADLPTYISTVGTVFEALPDDEPEVFELELTPVALALPYKPITETALQVRLQLEQLLVPLGINRSLGDATGQVVLQLKAVQELSEQVVLQLESGEQDLLAESFSAGLGLGGNLS